MIHSCYVTPVKWTYSNEYKSIKDKLDNKVPTFIGGIFNDIQLIVTLSITCST